MGRPLLSALILLALPWGTAHAKGPPDAGRPGNDPVCMDAMDRTPIIEAGRERDVRMLLAPHTVGGDLAQTGWRLEDVAIERDEIHLHLQRGKAVARLRLSPAACAGPDSPSTLSFALHREPPPVGPSAKDAFEALESALRTNDSQPFYKVWAGRPPPAPTDASAPPSPWRTLALTGWVLLAGLLGLLWGVIGAIRSPVVPGVERLTRHSWLFLAAVVLAGALMRLALDPVFLREAYPLASVGHLDRGIRWAAELTAYPRGQWLLVAGIRPLLPDSPYDAWFLFNQLQGALTIPAAFFALRALTGRVPVALAAAALLAGWPQHIRFSASESTHIALVLWAFLTLGWIARAARTGRLSDFVAAATSAATMVMMRPEAGLWGPGLVVLALGVAPGIRQAFARPASSVPRVLLVLGLLALLLPQLQITGGDAVTLGPAADSPEALDLDSLLGLPTSLFLAGPLNAFFDPATSPLWLWPLAWIGVLTARGRGSRITAFALMGTVALFFLLYVKMPPAVTLWAMGRYHLAVLPAVVILAALGLEWAVARVGLTAMPRRLPAVAGLLATLGALLWWSPMAVFPFDWQTEQAWLVSQGKARPRVLGPETRLVTPDNRRRFGDMSPREAIFALGETQRLTSEVVTVEHALRGLNISGVTTDAVYYEGLYCHFALAPGETTNPQCEAMHQTFELESMGGLTIDAPAYLLAYVGVRPEGPLPIGLYRVGARRLPPAAALKLLPQPVAHGDTESGSLVMGTSTRASMEQPEPRLSP